MPERRPLRVTPAVSYSATNGRHITFPYYASGGLTIPLDNAVFAYDEMGNLEEADNGYAEIDRTYTLDGLISSETLGIQKYGVSGVMGPYTTSFSYDADRRLVEVDHPNAMNVRPSG